MRNMFLSTREASDLIASGVVLLAAGSAQALAALPRGKWIGGSTPYFMTAEGGRLDHDKVFCTVLDNAVDVRCAVAGESELPSLLSDRFGNGFSYLLIPAFSAVHQRFAVDAHGLPGLYDQPLIGWVTGIDLGDLGKVKPIVVNGMTGETLEDKAVVMHVALKPDIFAEADIVNLFTQGDGPDLVFPTTGFSASTCVVDGAERNFAEWLRETGAGTELPLVANYNGAMINVAFQGVHENKVDFYAPVVAGRIYRLAASVGDYPSAYGTYCNSLHDAGGATALSCNCILNYLYASLEGRTTGSFTGPVTFGEIAYILLNQTLVRLDLLSGNLAAAAD
jgi:hypothetical protein